MSREEWALLYPGAIDGPLDEILPVDDLEHAVRRKSIWAARGVESRVMHRVIPDWSEYDANKQEWCVYERRTGKIWTITPPTEHHAREEASYYDPETEGPHEAMPTELAQKLRNAWCAGRLTAFRTSESEGGIHGKG